MATTTTTKKTAAARAAVEEYDFDSWTEEDEQKALAALTPDIRHIIVEGSFVGRFPDGVIVKIPLKVTMDQIDQLEAGSGNPVDQFKSLLADIGSKEIADEFSRHDLTECIVMSQKFFTILQKVSQAALPE